MKLIRMYDRSREEQIAQLTTDMAKVFGRLRTKTFHAGTRGPHVLCYGESGFRVVLVVLGAALLRELRLA